MNIESLYAGKITILQPEGQSTGIYKDEAPSVEVGLEGILTDHQADKRYHGGREKALHQYAISSYATMIEHYPELAGKAIAGSMGENISCAAMHDYTVCIGDIYRMGKVLVQVSQPRNPCWKINHKFEVDLLSKLIIEQAITGWYYRVLETGTLQKGDTIELVERPNPDVSVRYFVQINNQHRPAPEDLNRLLSCKGLAADRMQRLFDRKAFLEQL